MTTLAAPTEPAARPAASGRRADLRGGVLALFDQAAVSGTNFLTVVLVGRAGGQTELGYYSLGFSALVLAACVQEALVASPYTVFREAEEGRARRAYSGSVLVQQLLLALLVAAGLAVAAAAGDAAFGRIGWVVAAVVPAVLLREFGRRFAFARLRMTAAIALDLAVAAVQLGGLLWLVAADALTAPAAYWVIGAACGVAGLAALAANRREFASPAGRVGADVRRHWAFGRWVAAGQLVGAAHGYAVPWLLALCVGATATGNYAACVAVATLTNPLFLGLSNHLGPRAVRARTTGGPAAVRRVVRQASVVLLAGMGGFCLVAAVAGGLILRLLYGTVGPGQEFTLAVIAAALASTAPGMAADHGLRALGQPRAAMAGTLVGFAVTVIAAGLLIPVWGVAGAACGYFAGCLTGSMARLVTFLWLSAEDGGKS